MSTVVPEGENIRKAVKFISDERQSGSTLSVRQLVDQACLKFNLTPLETEYLERFMRQGGSQHGG
jgi:hypothetical protein